MDLANELRGLETPEAAPDFSRMIMARIEQIETTDATPAVAARRARAAARAGWALPATFAALATGIILMVFSGLLATTFGPLGRSVAVAMPQLRGAHLGPEALVAGVLIYVVGLLLSLDGRTDNRARRENTV